MRKQTLLLLTTMALMLAVAGGTAAAETPNGLIYHGCNSFGAGVCSVDPTASNPQPTLVRNGFNLFDISRDRTTIVYQRSGFGNQDLDQFHTAPLSADPYSQTDLVDITNLSAGLEDMTMPRFSPDGETIYFRGKHVVDPPEGADPRLYDVHSIYSVSTEGGEATRIPIDWVNADGTPRHIYSFALSHDGSKFAINGPFGVFTVPVGGGTPTRVNMDACGGAQSPSFSPDDRMIVYTSRIWSGANCTGTSHQTVYTTPSNNDGTRPGTPLFPGDATNTDIHDSKWWPTYSPDGEYIAFAHWRGSATDYLVTVSATNGGTRNITPCSFCVPVWTEKPLDTTITSVTSRPSEAGTTTSVAFSSNDDEATFECKLDNGAFEACASPKEYPGLPEGSSHTVEVRAVNAAGVADPTPAKRAWTVDTTAPTVIDVFPADGATGVAPNTIVEATFSEDMEAATIWDNFTLTKQGSSEPVAWSSMGYSGATKKANLDPATNLETSTVYRATIEGGNAGVKDIMGNALAQDRTWTFTTVARCTITGTANAETISGTSGADVICAGGGNDTVKGLGGNDTLKGEDGNDTLLGGVGNDALDGGLGTDTASYSASLTAVIASLATNSATGEGSDSFLGLENLLGSSKADTLTGSAANNTLTGGGGNDTERGGPGNDKVVGSGGADFLYGEDGADTVTSKDGVNGNDSLDGGTGTDTKVTDATEKSVVGFP